MESRFLGIVFIAAAIFLGVLATRGMQRPRSGPRDVRRLEGGWIVQLWLSALAGLVAGIALLLR